MTNSNQQYLSFTNVWPQRSVRMVEAIHWYWAQSQILNETNGWISGTSLKTHTKTSFLFAFEKLLYNRVLNSILTHFQALSSNSSSPHFHINAIVIKDFGWRVRVVSLLWLDINSDQLVLTASIRASRRAAQQPTDSRLEKRYPCSSLTLSSLEMNHILRRLPMKDYYYCSLYRMKYFID